MSVWELVVGHAEPVALLRDAVASGRVGHAWLFTGPAGVGKVHVAQVFAAALNCPAGGDGTCDTCRRVLRGVHPDVHLIEPEGDNLLVEDVRALREEAFRSRHEGRTMVFILDEADRMTEAAANALLKVLEEPPEAVVFVLVARSTDALAGTIPSRARVVSFAGLVPAEIAAALVAELGVDVEQAAWAATAGHGRLEHARALLTDDTQRARRAATLDLVAPLSGGEASAAIAAAASIGGLADEVVAQRKQEQARELADLAEVYGTARGTGALRKRLEVRHRRELRRARFEAIRQALADLTAAYRDVALLRASPPGDVADLPAALVHPDRAGEFARLAAAVSPSAAIRAAAALDEADRRLSIGAAPLLTLEAAFLSAQTALSGSAPPLARLAIRR
jgi:DNA polymerase III subunit delta'